MVPLTHHKIQSTNRSQKIVSKKKQGVRARSPVDRARSPGLPRGEDFPGASLRKTQKTQKHPCSGRHRKPLAPEKPSVAGWTLFGHTHAPPHSHNFMTLGRHLAVTAGASLCCIAVSLVIPHGHTSKNRPQRTQAQAITQKSKIYAQKRAPAYQK